MGFFLELPPPMLKYHATLSSPSLLPAIFHNVKINSKFTHGYIDFYSGHVPAMSCRNRQLPSTRCRARRRVRYEDGEDEGGEEEYGHNEEIAMLESYSQVAKDEALLVKAFVDEQEVEVLIFKGFSSSLSYGTCADPTRSILPARAVIKSIDRVKGPFDPSSIHYIDKTLTLEDFKTFLQITQPQKNI